MFLSFMLLVFYTYTAKFPFSPFGLAVDKENPLYHCKSNHVLEVFA